MTTQYFAIRNKETGELTAANDGQLNIFITREAAQACIDGPIASNIDEEFDSLSNYYIDDTIYIDE